MLGGPSLVFVRWSAAAPRPVHRSHAVGWPIFPARLNQAVFMQNHRHCLQTESKCSTDNNGFGFHHPLEEIKPASLRPLLRSFWISGHSVIVCTLEIRDLCV